MYKLFIAICLFTGIFFKSNAKAPVVKIAARHTNHPLQIDSSNLQLRKFNSTALNKYLTDPEFNYHTENNTNDSWWDRFWEWVWRMIEKLFGGKKASSSSSYTSPFIKYLFLALFAGLIIYLIIKIVGVENIFNRESKEINIPYSESLENIHEITFDTEIEKAMAQRNYRLAVRLLYLRCLKQLNDARLIDWKIEKTNSAYLNELSNSEQRQFFNILTKQFEYVWYGDFPIDVQSFQNINTLFVNFKKILP
jgi:Domain of unknown function (DUF4129)